MFPTLDIDSVVSEITESTNTDSDSTTLGRVIKINYADGKANVKMENGKPIEATTIAEKVQEYVKLLLRTQLNKFNVYENTEFGVTYFKYLGRRDLPMGFIQSEIKREIIEKIEKLDVVNSVSDFTSSLSGTTLTVKCTINLVDGTSTSTEEVVS